MNLQMTKMHLKMFSHYYWKKTIIMTYFSPCRFRKTDKTLHWQDWKMVHSFIIDMSLN